MPLEQGVFPIFYFNNDMSSECAIITPVVGHTCRFSEVVGSGIQGGAT
jgi:hypothetical protein